MELSPLIDDEGLYLVSKSHVGSHFTPRTHSAYQALCIKELFHQPVKGFQATPVACDQAHCQRSLCQHI